MQPRGQRGAAPTPGPGTDLVALRHDAYPTALRHDAYPTALRHDAYERRKQSQLRFSSSPCSQSISPVRHAMPAPPPMPRRNAMPAPPPSAFWTRSSLAPPISGCLDLWSECMPITKRTKAGDTAKTSRKGAERAPPFRSTEQSLCVVDGQQLDAPYCIPG